MTQKQSKLMGESPIKSNWRWQERVRAKRLLHEIADNMGLPKEELR